MRLLHSILLNAFGMSKTDAKITPLKPANQPSVLQNPVIDAVLQPGAETQNLKVVCDIFSPDSVTKISFISFSKRGGTM